MAISGISPINTATSSFTQVANGAKVDIEKLSQEILNSPDIKQLAQSKGFNLSNPQTKYIFATQLKALSTIESGGKNLATASDNGNDSKGPFQIGKGESERAKKYGLSLKEGNLIDQGKLALITLMEGLNHKSEAKLQQDFQSIASGQTTGSNSIIESSRQYNGGPRARNNDNRTTKNYGARFAKELQKTAADPNLRSQFLASTNLNQLAGDTFSSSN